MGDMMNKDIQQLKNALDESLKKLDFSRKEKEYQELFEISQKPEFWQDSIKAQKQMQNLSKLEIEVSPWRKLKNEVDEIIELSQLSEDSMNEEIEDLKKSALAKYESLKKVLRFSGPYDDHNVLMSIHAGAGGTDAMDWVSMLLRMYLRWSEENDIKSNIIDESPGEEAGIKSVSLELSGAFLYGKLKGEHGVHRLVRLSPFNADAKRQTSFAKVEVLPKIDEPTEAPLDEKDLKIDVFRAGGHGGQSVNTTDSAVRVTHLPTGITVNIQNERSQIQNKETALTILRSKLIQLQQEQHKENLSDIKGPNQSAEWGSQIRSYVLHPYTMVKDLRSGHETTQAQDVLDGKINPFIEAFIA